MGWGGVGVGGRGGVVRRGSATNAGCNGRSKGAAQCNSCGPLSGGTLRIAGAFVGDEVRAVLVDTVIPAPATHFLFEGGAKSVADTVSESSNAQ